jgi:hypothetical protein
MPRIKTTSEKINGWKITQKATSPWAAKAKTEIRQQVLEHIGAENCHVFDAFAGEGGMYQAVWKAAASYVGCDKEVFSMDERPAFVAENCRLMRNLDLAPYTVFDMDAYGSPWEQVYILIKRRPVAPGERVGLVLTEGQGMKMDMGGMSLALSLVAGVSQYMSGMGAEQQRIVDRAVAHTATKMGCTIEKQWQAIGKHSSTIRYIGIVMKGNEA